MRTDKTPLLIPAVALVALTLSTSCSVGKARQELTASQKPSQDESSWAYFIDTGDDGDDPWTGGCHQKCSDPRCVESRSFWGSDWCSADKLYEWTNSIPPGAESDIKPCDCEEICQARGFATGSCVSVARVCEERWASASCQCS